VDTADPEIAIISGMLELARSWLGFTVALTAPSLDGADDGSLSIRTALGQGILRKSKMSLSATSTHSFVGVKRPSPAPDP
jgi:hypothetical protein